MPTRFKVYPVGVDYVVATRMVENFWRDASGCLVLAQTQMHWAWSRPRCILAWTRCIWTWDCACLRCRQALSTGYYRISQLCFNQISFGLRTVANESKYLSDLVDQFWISFGPIAGLHDPCACRRPASPQRLHSRCTVGPHRMHCRFHGPQCAQRAHTGSTWANGPNGTNRTGHTLDIPK